MKTAFRASWVLCLAISVISTGCRHTTRASDSLALTADGTSTGVLRGPSLPSAPGATTDCVHTAHDGSSVSITDGQSYTDTWTLDESVNCPAGQVGALIHHWRDSQRYACARGQLNASSLVQVAASADGNSCVLASAKNLPEFAAPACSRFKGAETHLKYFGFFCSSCDWVGSGSYTDEVKTFANVAWISSFDFAFVTRELQKAQDQGLFAVVDGIHIQLSPRPWAEWEVVLKPFVDSGTVIGFYVADDYFGGPAMDKNIQDIKGSFPQTATIVFLSYIPLPNVPFPTNVDWIGYEMYWGYDPRTVQLIDGLLGPNQRQILVPDMSVDAGLIGALAAQDPKIVGIIPFLWQAGGGVPSSRAYRENAGAANAIKPVGSCFKN